MLEIFGVEKVWRYDWRYDTIDGVTIERYDCYEMARPRCYETNAIKQRAYRMRKKGSVPVMGQADRASPANETDFPVTKRAPFETKKVGELRMVVIPREVLEAAPVVVKPVIFRDDYGRVISEAQWERLQERKRVAKERGYVIDDYSQ